MGELYKFGQDLYYKWNIGNVNGVLNQGTDVGLTPSFGSPPNMQDMIDSPAVIKAVLVNYENGFEDTFPESWVEYTRWIGKGQSSGASYNARCTFSCYFNSSTTHADRFTYLVNTINQNTGKVQSYEGQMLNTTFVNAVVYFINVVFTNNNNKILAYGVYIIERKVFEDGEVILSGYGADMVGAGLVAATSNNVYCDTNQEYIVFDTSVFKKVEEDGTPDTKPDGGYGGGENPTDTVGFPPLPNINLNVTGSSLYKLTAAQMSEFTAWLWSSDWTDNIKKLRSDPMQNLIGVSITDVPLAGGIDAKIVLGNVSSDKDGVIISRWAEINCGTITADEFYGTFADYEPYVHYTLYLPKVGFVSIPADIVTNNNITVLYHIELSSGEGICYVYLHNTRNGFGYIYNTYACQCCSNVALSASDHTAQIQASIQAGTSLLTSAVKGDALGMATGAISDAVNIATAKNPTSTRGAMGNMSSLMSYKKPYILITATYLTKPSGYKTDFGHAIYFTTKLSNLSGFFKTMHFHAEFLAPQEVIEEIQSLLDAGVFI